MYKKITLIGVAMAFIIAGCSRDADVASNNISIAADQFQINRRILFINGITDKYLLVIEGLCSMGNNDKEKEISVTCKIGPNEYKKHFLGLSDNVTYLVEQTDPFPADPYHYQVIFKPESIVPDIRIH